VAGKVKHKLRRKPAMPVFAVHLEYEPTDDREDGLLRVYEFLLRELEAKETDSEGEN
jgi:hypothetical protein